MIYTSFRRMSTRYSHKTYKETLSVLESLITQPYAPPFSHISPSSTLATGPNPSTNLNTLHKPLDPASQLGTLNSSNHSNHSSNPPDVSPNPTHHVHNTQNIKNAHKQSFNLSAMHAYVDTLKIPYNDISYIHVAGTKGKGSTCTFSESILRKEGYKTGLYTSPHLIDVRERIKINGEPVSKDVFIETVWDLLTKLQESDLFPSMTTYFRFMTLVSIQIFLNEQVDVAIMECGLGGRLDATNIINPDVCGITSIGYDHCSILGNTLEKIAFEKAGIIKSGVPVVVQQQGENVLNVFLEQAIKKNAPLFLSPELDSFEKLNNIQPIKLGLHGSHQRSNASLALTLTNIWKNRNEFRNNTSTKTSSILTRKTSHSSVDNHPSHHIDRSYDETKDSPSSRDHTQSNTCNSWKILNPFDLNNSILEGLSTCTFAGRSHCVSFPEYGIEFFLDGAHTAESLQLAIKWFIEATQHPENESSYTAEVSSDEDLEEITQLPTPHDVWHTSSQNYQGKFDESNDTSSVERFLIFNFTGGRDPEHLLHPLLEKRDLFSRTYFVPTDSTHASFSKVSELSEQDREQLERLHSIWGDDSFVFPSINALLEDIFKTPSRKDRHYFLTGSLYLVGDFLRKLSKIQAKSLYASNQARNI